MSDKRLAQGQLVHSESEVVVPKSMGTFSMQSPEITYIDNTKQNIIIIPEERLQLYAIEFKKNVEEKAGWGSSIGLSTSVLIALCTSNFHDLGRVDAIWIQWGFMAMFSISSWIFLKKVGMRLYSQFVKKTTKMNTPEELVQLCKSKSIKP